MRPSRSQTRAATDLTSRRAFLGVVSAFAAGALAADEPRPASRKDVDASDSIRARAARAGLKNVGSEMSEHFLGVGDAPGPYRAKALKLCEDLATTYLTHFRSKGFELAFPKDRLVVVTLASRQSYEAFRGEEVPESEGGHYDPNANLLAVFDFQSGHERKGGNVKTLNTFTLVHEAVHQLTYNTGLLDRDGDVPVAISEGFATYGELWQLSKPRIGQVNGLRLAVVKNPPPGSEWIPIETLLIDDDLFAQAATEQQAYAEAWLLVYELMQTKAGVKKLQAFLDAIRPRKGAGNRKGDAEEAFGDLSRLDAAVKKRARLLG